MYESTDKENTLAAVAAIVILVGCVVAAYALLPENCYFFDTRQAGFLCDGFDINATTQPCLACRDTRRSYVAHVVLLSGGVGFLLPFAVLWLRNRRRRESDQFGALYSSIDGGDKSNGTARTPTP